MSTLIQFRTHCLSPPLQFKKCSLLPTPPTSFLLHPWSDFSLPKLRGQRIFHSNGVLARAEDKPRNSSSPSSPSSSQQTQATDSEKKIQVGLVTFLLSSILDNLTTTIVMISLLRKLIPPSEYRKLLGAIVAIAANAGGAWTPIGDVTTTMLWIHGQISTLPTMKALIVPCVVSLAVPLALLSLISVKRFDISTSEVSGTGQDSTNVLSSEQMAPRGLFIFCVGIGALVFVPVFKALTGLPPFMGMLLGLGVLWILTDAIHYGESDRQKLKVPHALSRIDTQAALFFLGILLSISSLEAAGILRELANYLDALIPYIELIASAIGVVSAIIDNVPLVAATMGMYDLTSFPQDSEFWQLVAYCASTGGSMLIIGSAAGVAFMGMEKVDFFWYLRKVSGVAFAGYAAGIAAYLAIHNLHLSVSP